MIITQPSYMLRKWQRQRDADPVKAVEAGERKVRAVPLIETLIAKEGRAPSSNSMSPLKALNHLLFSTLKGQICEG